MSVKPHWRGKEVDILWHFSVVHLYYECTDKAFIALISGMKCYLGEYQLAYINSLSACCNFAYAECVCAHKVTGLKHINMCLQKCKYFY